MIADAVDTVPAWLVSVSFDCFVFSTCVGRLQRWSLKLPRMPVPMRAYKSFEQSAAAIAYGLNKKDGESQIIVYDMTCLFSPSTMAFSRCWPPPGIPSWEARRVLDCFVKKKETEVTGNLSHSVN